MRVSETRAFFSIPLVRRNDTPDPAKQDSELTMLPCIQNKKSPDPDGQVGKRAAHRLEHGFLKNRGKLVRENTLIPPETASRE